MPDFKLTKDNYYSQEANRIFMSTSEYKDFCGTWGIKGCEFMAMERLEGRYPEKKGLPLLVGGYVDAWFEGTLDRYKAEHPEMFRKDGCLKADFVQADYIIERVQRDPMFMYYMSGEKQVIMTGNIAGIDWKIKIDSLLVDEAIVDSKVMSQIDKNKWVEDIGEYLDFVRYWGYDIQGAVYQEIVKQNTGKKLPFIIAAVTKEEEPNLELIQVDQVYLDDALDRVKSNAPHVADVKMGLSEPEKCGICGCCRKNKVLLEPIMLSMLANRK